MTRRCAYSRSRNLQALITGLSFNRPEDPVDYLTNCLQEVKKEKPQAGGLKWDRFLKDSKAAMAAREQGKQPAQLPASFFFRQSANSAEGKAVQKAGKISPDKIVLVLGGPGSGKGTQCAKLVQDFGLKHISLGDLLRAEVAKCSPIGQQIDGMMKEGKIVPLNIVMQVLQQALNELGQTSRGVLIDGYDAFLVLIMAVLTDHHPTQLPS